MVPAAAAAATPARYRAVERGLDRLIAEPAGPPGAIATFHRGGRTTVLRAGRASVRTLQLDDTVGERLPSIGTP
jgi:hypothetical protein